MDKRLSERGQSLVEFAVILPLLVLLLMGIFDLGRAFNAYIVITNAARDGAYYGSMHAADTAGITQRVIAETQGSGITLTAANVNVSSTGVVGTPIRVTVTFDFEFLRTFLGRATLQLTGKNEMMIVR